jgi:hypothetical protein
VNEIVKADSTIERLTSFYQQHIVAAPDMHPCPQETIIQTYIGNQSSFNVSYQNHRFIDWENAINWSPHWLDSSHFERLRVSDCHWARKMSEEKSMDLIALIEKQLL